MNIARRTHKNTREKGFTLVEVLISLTIFSIAVTGVISVAAQGGLTIDTAKNKTTAAFLADEGLELMRAFRDRLVVSNPVGSESIGWTAFLSATSGCTVSTPCDIDASNSAGSAPVLFPDAANIVPCPASGCPLYYDPTFGYYLNTWPLGTPPQSRFIRSVYVTPAGSGDEAMITSKVVWLQGSTSNTVTVSEHVYNWYNP